MSKKLILLLTFSFTLLNFVIAQPPPNAFNYSAVARNAAGQPIATTTIGIQVSILKTSPTGASQYSENHFVNTDAYGLFNLVIGAGAVQSGSMSTIDWSNDNYYLKVGMDANGGTNFLTMGTTQLLSVPYALYAKSAGSVNGGAGFSGNYNDLTNSPVLAPVATSGSYNDLTNSPVLAPVATSGSYNDLTNAPVLAPVATSGSYNDLTNSPVLAPVATSGSYNDLTSTPNFATVAISGNYSDLANQPLSIDSISANGDSLFLSNGQVFVSTSNLGFSGDYNDLINTPVIPTNISSLTNDAGYVSTLNDDDPTNEIQQISVSATGDTLHLQNGGFVIIPGISAANTPVQLATLMTSTVSSITSTTAISGGNITNGGGAAITARGIVWGASQSPTLAGNLGYTNDGTGTGSFTSNLTGLTANTSYYVRAYATNSAGTAYGNELSFTTSGSGSGGIVTNPGAGVTFDGYTYSSIVLGNGQEWMAENLRTTTYANGDPIPNVTDNTQWTNLTTGAWSHYNNDSQYENPYGKLYNFHTVADSRNVCPSGWHVPQDSEWLTLVNYLDPNETGDYVTNIAGGKMKSTGFQYWSSPNTDASNESGFSGHPGGCRNPNFLLLGVWGCWWDSSNIGTNASWFRYVDANSGVILKDLLPREYGVSIRCLKD